MSKDEHSLPPSDGAELPPDPEGPASPPQDVDGMTLRRQVMEVINDVLTDPCPEGEWARKQLRELLAAHPDEPERALLKHLVITRELTAAAKDEDRPGPRTVHGWWVSTGGASEIDSPLRQAQQKTD